MNLGVVPPLMRVRVSLKKVHEFIKYMAIKVQDENFLFFLDTHVISGSVHVVTGFVTRNNWFNPISSLGFEQSIVTIILS